MKEAPKQTDQNPTRQDPTAEQQRKEAAQGAEREAALRQAELAAKAEAVRIAKATFPAKEIREGILAYPHASKGRYLVKGISIRQTAELDFPYAIEITVASKAPICAQPCRTGCLYFFTSIRT